MKKILVPVDGTDSCSKALDYAKDLAEKFDSEILIFNSQEISPSFVWLNDPVIINNTEYDPEKIAHDIVEQTSELLRKKNPNLKIHLKTSLGDPAHAILDIAESEECDLILMSTHGMKAVRRFLLGSVTNKVVHHAHIPVLVVR